MKNLRILICEDNDPKANEIRKFIYKKFSYGVDVDIADDLAACKDKILHKKYNLIFVDFNMPHDLHTGPKNDSGELLIQYIKEKYDDGSYEIILLTSIKEAKEKYSYLIDEYDFIDYTYTVTKSDILEQELSRKIDEKSKLLKLDLSNKEYDIVIITALNDEM